MKERHITDLLDAGRGSITGEDRIFIDRHVAGCESCSADLKNSLIADTLVSARSSEFIEPSPFFSTRVMAALRERQTQADPFTLFNLWHTARGLITGMAALVLLLVGISISDGFTADNTTVTRNQTASATLYSPEQLIQSDLRNVNFDPTNAQVYQAVLGPEDVNADY
jgi:hypothetical protein